MTNQLLERLHIRATNTIGRRSVVLLAISIIFMLIGVQAILYPVHDNTRMNFYLGLPDGLRAALWLLPSTVAIIIALRRQQTQKDEWGFGALACSGSIIFFSSFFSWVAFLFGFTDYGQGWVDCLKWLLILVVLFICSGWAEVPRRVEAIKALPVVNQDVLVLNQSETAPEEATEDTDDIPK